MSREKKQAFLKAYARSGNMTLAAEQAGMSRSWAVKARRSDAGFDSDCRAAKAASAERLGGGDCNRPPASRARRDEADLVVTRAGKRPPQVTRAGRGRRWTPRIEARFLGELRRCNNLRLACARAGMTLSSYEAHWRRWPGFRRRVSEARAFARLWLGAGFGRKEPEPIRLDIALELEAEASIGERIRLARRHSRRR